MNGTGSVGKKISSATSPVNPSSPWGLVGANGTNLRKMTLIENQ